MNTWMINVLWMDNKFSRERERERASLPLLSVSCYRTLALAAMADTMAIDTMVTTGKPRVRILRRLAAIILQYSQIISTICFAAGVITVLLLPVLSKTTYISENALMPGSANPVFGSKSAIDASRMVDELQSWVTKNPDGYMAVRGWAMKHMSAIGADFYLQTYSSPEKPLTSMRFFSSPQHLRGDLNTTMNGNLGVNVVGIIKAPRSEGNEAVVLVTPFTVNGGMLSSGDTMGLCFGMALFELYANANWLARDVIWVLADSRYGAHTAVASWLQEYHEPRLHLLSQEELADLYNQIGDDTRGLNSAPLLEFKRAGFIAAGLVFDVSSGNKGPIDFIKVSGEGPNGQMPNLDLINVVNTLAQWRRLNIRLDTIKDMEDLALVNLLGQFIEKVGLLAGKLNSDWGFVTSASSYTESLATLFASILNQAIGGPSGAHGAFRDYQIDAVTLNMIAGGDLQSTTYQIDLLSRYGRLVDGVMRSVNNLLEKFHQSFFLYLLCGPGKFVSVGVYMIPLGLLLVTLPLSAAALNSESGKEDAVDLPSGISKSMEPFESGTEEHLNSRSGKISKGSTEEVLDLKTTKMDAGRWRRSVLVVSAVQLWASLVALLPPVVSHLVDTFQVNLTSTNAIPPVGTSTTMSLKASCWATISLLSLIAMVTSVPAPKAGDWMAIKALLLGVATIGLVVMSQINFAVSLLGAVVLVPSCLCSLPFSESWRKTSKKQQWKRTIWLSLLSLVGTIISSLGSPPVLLAIAACYLGDSHWQAVLEKLWQWTELLWSWGSALYIYIVVVHLPCSILSLYILFL